MADDCASDGGKGSPPPKRRLATTARPPTAEEVASVAQLDAVARSNLLGRNGGGRYQLVVAPPNAAILFVGTVDKVMFGGDGGDGGGISTADDARFVDEGDTQADTRHVDGLVSFKAFVPDAPLRLDANDYRVPTAVAVSIGHAAGAQPGVRVYGPVPRGLRKGHLAVVFARATAPNHPRDTDARNPSFQGEVYYGDMMLLLRQWTTDKTGKGASAAVAAQALLALLTAAVATPAASLSLQVAALSDWQVRQAMAAAGANEAKTTAMAKAVAIVYSAELRALLEAFPLLNPMAACDIVEYCKVRSLHPVELCRRAPYQAAAIAVQQDRVRGLHAQDALAIHTLDLDPRSRERVRRFLAQGVRDVIMGYSSNFEQGGSGATRVAGNDAPFAPAAAAMEQAWARYRDARHEGVENLPLDEFRDLAFELARDGAAPWYPLPCDTCMHLPTDFGLVPEYAGPDGQAWLYPQPLYAAEVHVARVLAYAQHAPIVRPVAAYHRSPGGAGAVLRMHATGVVPPSVSAEARLKPFVEGNGGVAAADATDDAPLAPGAPDPGGRRDAAREGRWRMDAVQLSVARGIVREHNVMCLTGAGGTGKTDATAGTVDALLAEGFNVVYVGFTGRAVENARVRLGDRASEKMWGGGPMTAHRFVQKVVMAGALPYYDGRRADEDEGAARADVDGSRVRRAQAEVEGARRVKARAADPLAPERPLALIVDETSMLSLLCLGAVLSVPHFRWSRILLVGDPVQLPAIDPGTTFHELLRPPAPQLPTVVLEHVYRTVSATGRPSAAAEAGKLIRAFIAEDEAVFLLRDAAPPRRYPTRGAERLAALEAMEAEGEFELYLSPSGGPPIAAVDRLPTVLEQYHGQAAPCPMTNADWLSHPRAAGVRVRAWLAAQAAATGRVMALAALKVVAHELAVTARRRLNAADDVPPPLRFDGHRVGLYRDGKRYWNDPRDRDWRVGDRVMCLSNLYAKDGGGQRMLAANGFMGVVVAGNIDLQDMRERPGAVAAQQLIGFEPAEVELISRWLPEPEDVVQAKEQRRVVVVAPASAVVGGYIEAGRLCVFTLSAFNENFCLAYVSTIHKAQGSEWDRVDSHLDDGALNTAQILYTAVTRAKARARLFGLRKTLERALTCTLGVVRRPSLFLRRFAAIRDALIKAAAAARTEEDAGEAGLGNCDAGFGEDDVEGAPAPGDVLAPDLYRPPKPRFVFHTSAITFLAQLQAAAAVAMDREPSRGSLFKLDPQDRAALNRAPTLMCPTATKNFAYAHVRPLLLENGLEPLIHTADEDDKVFREEMDNINAAFQQRRAWVFSSRVTCGVDLQEEVGMVFMYCDARVEPPRVFLQMLGRARRVMGSVHVLVGRGDTPGPLPTEQQKQEIRDAIAKDRQRRIGAARAVGVDEVDQAEVEYELRLGQAHFATVLGSLAERKGYAVQTFAEAPGFSEEAFKRETELFFKRRENLDAAQLRNLEGIIQDESRDSTKDELMEQIQRAEASSNTKARLRYLGWRDHFKDTETGRKIAADAQLAHQNERSLGKILQTLHHIAAMHHFLGDAEHQQQCDRRRVNSRTFLFATMLTPMARAVDHVLRAHDIYLEVDKDGVPRHERWRSNQKSPEATAAELRGEGDAGDSTAKAIASLLSCNVKKLLDGALAWLGMEVYKSALRYKPAYVIKPSRDDKLMGKEPEKCEFSFADLYAEFVPTSDLQRLQAKRQVQQAVDAGETDDDHAPVS